MLDDTKFWCLRTHNYITAIPEWAIKAAEGKEGSVPVTIPQEKTYKLLDIVIAFAIHVVLVYLTWNFGVVAALTVAKSVTFLESVAITLFINILRFKR